MNVMEFVVQISTALGAIFYFCGCVITALDSQENFEEGKYEFRRYHLMFFPGWVYWKLLHKPFVIPVLWARIIVPTFNWICKPFP